MRTTLTIDDDNAVRLERLRRQRHASLKNIVNDAIRSGLDHIEKPKKHVPFKTASVDLGKPLFNSPEELKELIARLDEEDDLRKLRLP